MKTTLSFLRQLKENNDRDWFHANKKEYEEARAELSALVAGLIQGIGSFDPDILSLQPKDCMFRINRDIRFSNDKSPYKTNMGAVIAPGGKKSRLSCYYIHIDPEACFLAGGIYMPENLLLQAVRQEIDYNLEEFERILKRPSFMKYFKALNDEGRLKTSPKGYASDNPAIEYLRNKSFTVSSLVEDKTVLAPNFSGKVVTVFRELYPLNQFFNRAILDHLQSV